MAAIQVFEVSEVEGKQYVTTEARGVQYTLCPAHDGWGVWSRRLSLGRWNTGGYKSYPTLADVAKGCKAFADFFALEAA